MSETPAQSQTEIELLPLPDVAVRMGLGIIQVEQLVKDGLLIVVRNAAGIRTIPAAFVQDGEIVKHLGAVITLLRDNRFTDAEVVDWLHRPDESLPGSPIEALRKDRSREIKRRAQAAGF
jgi:hypothetical protein